MNKQPKALMLIDQLDEIATYSSKSASWALDVANALERLYVVNQELVEALEECADELTAWISDRYPESDLRFPSIQKDFQLDMSVVDKAKAALKKARGEV